MANDTADESVVNVMAEDITPPQDENLENKISFHPDGTVAGIGPLETYPFLFESTLALRYRFKDDKVVDLYPGLTDEEVMDKVLEENEARAAADQAKRDALPYTITKYTIQSRMTDDESDTFEEDIETGSSREKRMWNAMTSMVSTEDYFTTVKNRMIKLFDAERTKQILARNT
jgi:hypothetical protein